MSPFDRLGLFAVSLMFCALSGAVDAASVPVSAVTVTQVQNVNEPGLNPYQHFVTFNQSSAYCYNFACTVELPAVPEGRRLVITYASASFALQSGGTLANVALASSANQNDRLMLPAPALDGLGRFYLSSSPVTFYVDEGYHPLMILGGQYMLANGENTAQVSVVGYLVSL
jgi:hypothetical protein